MGSAEPDALIADLQSRVNRLPAEVELAYGPCESVQGRERRGQVGGR
jgi:hypothetical protein